ncbi:S8 family serine peptidase [Micromonospora yangpuensis]|uniref:S8 family serine peptidase n=1 Tax=Micromonospora yangpuensis TaxID=683228 RepID=UPI001E2890CE|nr:S8 family serine peptidase [Micromonospora yangpuensis]
MIGRSAAAGLALVCATSVACAVTGSAALAAPGDSQRAPVRGTEHPGAVPDRYIVVLKGKASATTVRSTASALTRANGGKVRKVYTKALNGYSAAMTRRQAQQVAADPAVAYVEQVQRATASASQPSPPSWGLDRIDQVTPKLNNSYSYSATGKGVTAYVIDTGIDVKHADFGGRAVNGWDFVDDDPIAEDCDGHGTHVAGTVGGTKYGVAKEVDLVAVRVLDCYGSGSSEQILAAVDWVTANAAKPAVVNMSLGFGGINMAVDDAVNRSISSGLTYAVAAGNSMQNACEVSPAAVPAAITVGATDRIDYRAWFSNYGSCLDIFAPGASIVSAKAGTSSGSIAFNGTSMASPHVAGAAALLLQANKALTPKQVRDAIVTNGSAGAVHDSYGSIDRMLRVGKNSVARSSFGLKARSNGAYVTAQSKGTQPLLAKAGVLGGWEKYDIVDAGGGLVGLRAKANGKFVTAQSKGTGPLLAKASAIGGWEKFQLVHNTDGTVSLKATVNGKYVTTPSAGKSPLIASKTSISTWEKFDLDAPAPVVSIKSRASNKFVTTPSAGKSPLVPSKTSVSTWEKFEVVNLDGGYFALKALSNGKYVTAESAGSKPLVARSTSIGDWQVFDFLDYNPDGTVYVRAYIDVQAVTAGSAGTSQLISSRNINWESETLGLGNGEKFYFSAA